MAKRCVCGAVMDDDMMFCTECGKKLEDSAPAAKGNTCPECGAALEPGDAFCTNCGCDLRTGGAKGPLHEPEPEDESTRRVIIGKLEKPSPEPALDEHFHVPGDL